MVKICFSIILELYDYYFLILLFLGSLRICFYLFVRFPEEISYYRKCQDRRNPLGNMQSETIEQHNHAKSQYGIHCPVLEIFVFFYSFNVAYSKLADDNCANSVPN